MSFLFRKVKDVTTISKSQSLSYLGEYKNLHLESSKQNYYIISLRAIIKAIFTSHAAPLWYQHRKGKNRSCLDDCWPW